MFPMVTHSKVIQSSLYTEMQGEPFTVASSKHIQRGGRASVVRPLLYSGLKLAHPSLEISRMQMHVENVVLSTSVRNRCLVYFQSSVEAEYLYNAIIIVNYYLLILYITYILLFCLPLFVLGPLSVRR